MSEASGEKVRIVCGSCAARFKAPASKAGKKGKCPKCGAIFVVPSAAPAGPPADEPSWSAISDAPGEDPVLALAAASATTSGSRKRGGTSVGTGALDGLTPAQRQLLAARVQEKMTKDFQRFDEEEPAGSLPAGIIGAIICALLAAGLWFGIFAGTGKELRFMSLAVGALAGGGMYLGLQRRSSTAALAAAAIALGGIIAAKVAFVGWGEPFKAAAMAPPPLSKVEQQIDDEYARPDPLTVNAAVRQWVDKDYLYEHNLTYDSLGYNESDRQRHEWAMIDRRDALSAEEGFEAMYRWNYYRDHLAMRQRHVERDWDTAQQIKAAEAAMDSAGPVAAPGKPDAEAGTSGAGRDVLYENESEMDDEGEPLGISSYDWSPEKKAAMEKVFAELEKSFFMEVKQMPAEEVRRYYNEQREAERRARKIAAKQAGEEIEEKFVELGEDPVAAAAAAEEATKYQPIDVQDIIAIPLALAAAWFLGRGWS